MSRRDHTYERPEFPFVVTLTDGATVSWDVAAAKSAVVTLGGNRMLAAPTGEVAGETYVLRVLQDGTGGRTITWNAVYLFHADGVPILSTAANDTDTFLFVSDGTNMHCITPQKRGLGLRGYIDGLIMSNDTDTAHDISVAAGEATMVESTTSETRVVGVNTAAFVKRIDANWAAGTGNGGFPSGLTLSNTTWYHYFIIGTTAGAVDFGWDTSTTATNLLSDASTFSFQRRIGSVITDGSANIINFQQYGDAFMWLAPVLDLDEAISATGETEVMTVPTGFPMGILGSLLHHTTAHDVYISSPDVTDTAPSLTASPGISLTAHTSSDIGANILIYTNTASTLRFRSSNNLSEVRFWTNGWIDPRGRAA